MRQQGAAESNCITCPALVLDASTLILIAKTEVLDRLLHSLEHEVAIPPGVEKECCAVKKSLDALIIRKALEESRIRWIAIKDRKLVPKLQKDFGLGRGEAEAIVLALADKACVLGIDDKSGVNACKLLGVVFTTAIGILVRMREKQLLTRNESITKLERLAKHGRLQEINFGGRQAKTAGTHMTKTMSIRMDRENFEFLNELIKEQRSDLSKAVRDMVSRGRVLLALERYKKGEASLGRAAQLAGVPVGQMMTILTEFGVGGRIGHEDYLEGIAALRKAW
jgi:predicted nucleic acid-binding protein/predicted HTH domain antitoxin